MALVLKDRVKQTASAPGTGTITLSGSVAGFQSFSAVGNGNTTYFAIVDPTSGDWEVNYGTYTSSGTTLTRNSPPLSSSNSGSLVNFTGAVDVFLTYPSESAVWRDTAGVVAQQSFGAITATSAALTTGTVSTTPASNTDIANKQYVDGLVTQGISYHEPVYVESPNTAGNLTATYNQPGGAGDGVGATLTNAGTKAALTIDGVLMTTTKRVLIYNQTNAYENGVYTVTTVGTPDPGGTNWVLTRSTDADTYGLRDPNSLGYNDAFFVTNGDTGAGETYVCTTTGVITFGTTNITFAQISSAQVYNAGTGLNLSPATTFNISNTGVTANTYGSASAVPVITVNAQGQATSITDTNIAINGSQVSGNITGSAGSVANALTLGSYLTGTSFNGSSAVTATVDATSANTASKVVARDASGNFSAGTITATLSGSATSATTATNLAGGTANQIPFQASAGTTSFATAPSATGQFLGWNGSAFAWSVPSPSAATPTALGTVYGKTNSATAFETFLGYQAGNVSTGVSNVFVGYQAGFTNSTGLYNTAIGATALRSLSTGQQNTAIGTEALYSNTANNNIGIGVTTLRTNTSGADNLAIGVGAGYSNLTSSRNVFIGGSAGYYVTGASNTLIGTGAGASGTNNLTTGANNIIIGDNASASAATVSNEITLGNTSNTIFRIPGLSLTWNTTSGLNSLGVGTPASGTAGEIRATNNVTAYYSDDRLKTRLGVVENALDKVRTLDSFYYEANKTAQELGYKPVREVGISAQQVQAIMPEVVAPAPIDDKYLTVRYERLVPLLLAAIKELEAKVQALEVK